MVMLVLSTMVFGAADLMHVLHAYSTMQSGVQETLRCATSIDSCRIAENRAPTRQYKVYRVEHGPSDYYLNTYNYQLVSSWFRFNAYRYQTEVTVPDRVRIEYDTQQYSAIKHLYPLVATPSYYVRTSGLPAISGSSADDVRITYPEASNRSFPAAVDKSISQVRLVASASGSSTLSETIRFTIPRPYPASGRPCYLSRDQGEGPSADHDAAFRKSCSDNWPWKDGEKFFNAHPTALETNTFVQPKDSQEVEQFTYIVIQILGNAGGDNGSKGSLEVLIAPKPRDAGRSPQWRTLNGRIISPDSSGNLMPRGAHPDNYSGGIKEAYRDLEIEYHQAIRVPYDREIMLRFVITRDRGSRLIWTGNHLRIFTPRYKLVKTPFLCDNQINKAELAQNSYLCQSKVPAEAIVSVEPDLGGLINSAPPVELGCQVNQAAAEGFLAKKVADPLNYELFRTSSASCGKKISSYSCPNAGSSAGQGYPVNYGIDSCGFESAATIKAICPPPDQNTASLVEAGQISCTEKKAIVRSKSDPEWVFQPASCIDLTDQKSKMAAIMKILPSDLKQYRKIAFTNETPLDTVYNDYYFTGESTTGDGGDIRNYVQHDLYGCPQAKLAQLVFFKGASRLNIAGQEIQVGDLPASSPFKSNQPDLGCDWQAKLKTGAFESGANSASYLQIFPPSKSYEIKKVDESYLDSCMSYQTNRPHNAQKVLLGTFAENKIPTEYSGPDYYKEFVGFIGSPPSYPELDYELAQEVGKRLITAFFPKAKFDCENGGYCTSMELSKIDDQIKVKARMELPLMLFFRRSMAVSYSQAKTEEISFH